MDSKNPLHEEVFIDLCQRSPRKGFNIKAFEAMKRQQLIEALDSLLTLLNIAHDLRGEKKRIIGFRQDPLSWGVWITSPVAYKPNVIYAHCVDTVKEFPVDCRSTLIVVAKFILGKEMELLGKRDLSLRPKPKKDDELICMLMDPEPSTYTYFQEAERAIDRDCLLDACISLFRPFGLQPRHKDDQVVFLSHYLQDQLKVKDFQIFFDLSSIKDALAIKHLQPRSEPLVRIERLEAYFDSVEASYPESLPYTITHAAPSDPQPWTSRGMRTMVLLFLDYSLAARVGHLIKGRFVPKIIDAALYTSYQAAHPEADLNNALVFNLASPIDRIQLVQCVLCIRNQQRIHDNQEQRRHIWHGKVGEEDKKKRNKNYKAMLAKLREMTGSEDSTSSLETEDGVGKEDEYETSVETLFGDQMVAERVSPPPAPPQEGETNVEELAEGESAEQPERQDSGNEGDAEPEDNVSRRKWKRWSRIRLF